MVDIYQILGNLFSTFYDFLIFHFFWNFYLTFTQQTNRLEVIKKYTGKNKNTETNEKKNCYICKNTVKVYKKPDKYIEAVAMLYEEENKTKQEEKGKIKNG